MAIRARRLITSSAALLDVVICLLAAPGWAQVAPAPSHWPVEVGFRTGWAESPYDLPGGYFWGFFADLELLTRSSGVPYGDLSAELLGGVIEGATRTPAPPPGPLQLTLADASPFPLNPTRESAETIEIQPTLQYHLDLDALGPFRPYALLGPALYVTMIEREGSGIGPVFGPASPFLGGGVAAAPNQSTTTDFRAGYTTGLGFRFGLSALRIAALQPILDRLSLGGEWRYNGLTNGEQFQQYTGSIAVGF